MDVLKTISDFIANSYSQKEFIENPELAIMANIKLHRILHSEGLVREKYEAEFNRRYRQGVTECDWL